MSCMVLQWVGTADGTEIPPVGSLYIHDESLRWSSDDQPSMGVEAWGTGKLAMTRVDGAVARIDYDAPPGTLITVRSKLSDEVRTYKVSEAWHAPTPRVLQFWHHAEEWTCSYSDSLAIQLDQPTAAIRARWTFHGRTVDYIEPARTEGSMAVLELGKIDCGGSSIPPEQLAEGGDLDLFAIRFDGVEAPIHGMPRHIKLSDAPTRADDYDDAMRIIVGDDAGTPADPYRPTGTIGGVALAIAALGIGLGLRTRVRAPDL